MKRDGLLFPAPPNGVEFFEAEADRIHQAMAAGTGGVDHMLLEAFAVCLWFGLSNRRKRAVRSRRGIGNAFTHEVLAYEEPTHSRRGLRRFAGESEEGGLAEYAGTIRTGGELDPVEVSRGWLEVVKRCEFAVQERVPGL